MNQDLNECFALLDWSGSGQSRRRILQRLGPSGAQLTSGTLDARDLVNKCCEISSATVLDLRSNAEALSDHVRCGTRALGLLLRNANAVLAALTGRDEELDGAEPVSMKLVLEPDAVAAEE